MAGRNWWESAEIVDEKRGRILADFEELLEVAEGTRAGDFWERAPTFLWLASSY
jgi:hypothetical protein